MMYLHELEERIASEIEIGQNWACIAVEHAASADLAEQKYKRTVEIAALDQRKATDLVETLDREIDGLDAQVRALCKALARAEEELDTLRLGAR